MSIPLEACAGGERRDPGRRPGRRDRQHTREGSRYVLTGAAVVGRSAGEQGGGLVGGVRAGGARDLGRGRRRPSARAGRGDRGRHDHGRAFDGRPADAPSTLRRGRADDAVCSRIGVVLSPRSWSGRLHAFIADHVPDVELIMVRDQQAALEAGAARAADRRHHAVADASRSWTQAEHRGIRLVGVYDRADGGVGRDRLADARTDPLGRGDDAARRCRVPARPPTAVAGRPAERSRARSG